MKEHVETSSGWKVNVLRHVHLHVKKNRKRRNQAGYKKTYLSLVHG